VCVSVSPPTNVRGAKRKRSGETVDFIFNVHMCHHPKASCILWINLSSPRRRWSECNPKMSRWYFTFYIFSFCRWLLMGLGMASLNCHLFPNFNQKIPNLSYTYRFIMVGCTFRATNAICMCAYHHIILMHQSQWKITFGLYYFFSSYFPFLGWTGSWNAGKRHNIIVIVIVKVNYYCPTWKVTVITWESEPNQHAKAL